VYGGSFGPAHESTGTPSCAGVPPGLSPLARQGNAIVIEEVRTMRACSPGSVEQRRISPACKRSSCSMERASKASSSGASGRGRCIQRRRISAARGSETARSRRPRSMSASLGGASLWRSAGDTGIAQGAPALGAGGRRPGNVTGRTRNRPAKPIPPPCSFSGKAAGRVSLRTASTRAETSFDLGVRKGLTLTASCAADLIAGPSTG
jgi:hypothetical protein